MQVSPLVLAIPLTSGLHTTGGGGGGGGLFEKEMYETVYSV